MGGEPVSTVVESETSQSADTVRDNSTTVDNPERPGNEDLNQDLDQEKAASSQESDSPASGISAGPTGDSADDAVADEPAGTTSVLDLPSDPPDAVGAEGAVALSGTGEGKNLDANGEPPDLAGRLTEVTETLEASALVPEIAFTTEVLLPEVLLPEVHLPKAWRAPGVWDAADAVTDIYHVHYNQFVRLAVLLLHDVQTAEEVVQDAFEAMHVAWRRLNDKDKALQYLRQTVVNKSRSVLRHRKVVDLHAPKPAPDEPSAEHAALVLLERSAVGAALRSLPERQREAIALRYYADFSEADIAKAMGISKGAVKSHTARAMATLKTVLSQQETS